MDQRLYLSELVAVTAALITSIAISIASNLRCYDNVEVARQTFRSGGVRVAVGALQDVGAHYVV
jgi:hypothetical protein